MNKFTDECLKLCEKHGFFITYRKRWEVRNVVEKLAGWVEDGSFDEYKQELLDSIED